MQIVKKSTGADVHIKVSPLLVCMLHPPTGLHPIDTTQKKIFKSLKMATADH